MTAPTDRAWRRSNRWPGWVYSVGSEPDVRFSLANERTFLAWIRTAIALAGAGLALDFVRLTLFEPIREALAMGLCALGAGAALTASFRWARAERAIRVAQPLPGVGLPVLMVSGTAVAVATAATLVRAV